MRKILIGVIASLVFATVFVCTAQAQDVKTQSPDSSGSAPSAAETEKVQAKKKAGLLGKVNEKFNQANEKVHKANAEISKHTGGVPFTAIVAPVPTAIVLATTAATKKPASPAGATETSNEAGGNEADAATDNAPPKKKGLFGKLNDKWNKATGKSDKSTAAGEDQGTNSTAPADSPQALPTKAARPNTAVAITPGQSGGGLKIGEYACYGSGGQILAGWGFKVLSGNRYTDLDGKEHGTFSVSADTVTFHGGHLDGQVGRELRNFRFRIGKQADCKPF